VLLEALILLFHWVHPLFLLPLHSLCAWNTLWLPFFGCWKSEF
jgi:hypothetical protein